MTAESKVVDPEFPGETPWLVIDQANADAIVAGPFATSIEAILAREETPYWYEADYWVVPERALNG